MATFLFFLVITTMALFLLKSASPKKKSLREIDFNYRPFIFHTTSSKFTKSFRKIQ